MANKRITDVDFIESLNSGESFFVNQNNILKQINKSDVVFDIVNGGTGATTVEDAQDNLGITVIVKNINDEITTINNNVTTINNNITTVDNKWSGCWIEFTDEDGNPTDEPYIHWYTKE